MKCDKCTNYVCHFPTWNEPSHEEYCKVYGDFCNMEHDKIVCNKFELSKYWQKISIKFRIKKLERIIHGN